MRDHSLANVPDVGVSVPSEGWVALEVDTTLVTGDPNTDLVLIELLPTSPAIQTVSSALLKVQDDELLLRGNPAWHTEMWASDNDSDTTLVRVRGQSNETTAILALRTVDLPPLLTIKDLAELLQLSPSAIYRMIARGDGPMTIELSKGTIRIDRDDLETWLTERKQKTSKKPDRPDWWEGDWDGEVQVIRYS